jgi:hypothetical protein
MYEQSFLLPGARPRLFFRPGDARLEMPDTRLRSRLGGINPCLYYRIEVPGGEISVRKQSESVGHSAESNRLI